MAVHQNADGRRGDGGGGGEISAAALLSAILLPLLAAGSATAERTPAACVEVLVGVAPCLAFLAAAPINESSAPSPACCAAVAAYAEAGGRRDAGEGEGGGGACLCHLLRRPGLLGFPIVAARVPSLFFYCNSPDAVGSPSPDAVAAFRALCDGPRPVPPFRDSPAGSPVSSSPCSAFSSPPEIISRATRAAGRSVLLRFHRHLLQTAVLLLDNLEEITRIVPRGRRFMEARHRNPGRFQPLEAYNAAINLSLSPSRSSKSDSRRDGYLSPYWSRRGSFLAAPWLAPTRASTQPLSLAAARDLPRRRTSSGRSGPHPPPSTARQMTAPSLPSLAPSTLRSLLQIAQCDSTAQRKQSSMQEDHGGGTSSYLRGRSCGCPQRGDQSRAPGGPPRRRRRR